MDPASKLKAFRLDAPFNPKKKMTAVEHYDALMLQKPRKIVMKPESKEGEGINEPWRPPPSTPLSESLGAPGKRSPIVARNTAAPDTAPAARLSVEAAREKQEAAREKLERQLDQFERLVRERREAAAAAAAAAGAPPPAPVPELTEAERKEDFTRVGWTRVRASWCTSTRVVGDLTHFKATPLVRRALWQALLKDVLAASRMPPAKMYGALYVLYLALGTMRETFVRVLRNRHAPYKKPKDARTTIAVIMEDDLEEAAERAEAHAQAKARALAQAAASPDAPPAANTEASPTSAVSSPPPATESPSTSSAASPSLPSSAPPSAESSAVPSAAPPALPSAESPIQPSAEAPSLPPPVSPTASSAPSAAASPALPSAAPTVLPSAESPIQSPAESSIQSSEGPSLPPPVSPTALPAALRAVLPPTLLCKPTVDRPAPPPPIPPFERKPFKPVNELKRDRADDNEDDHPWFPEVCHERGTLDSQRASSRIPIGRHVQSRNTFKPTPGSRATSGRKGAKVAPA